ncbi:MAG: prolipoprotein diacylglyceryl transferase [Bifidobacteriaceae bacterium]|jgi:prolipoprotein diacylglyceryl transferase|nr:prolipoprotein diacylglyceryl transferase [Bifidobacteriaceae bacterium]
MTLAYIPSPTVSYFQIGNVTIHFYALTMLTGIIFAIWILEHRWKKMGGTFDQVLDAAIVAVPSGLVGARLFHVITVPYSYFPPSGNLLNILKVWEGGMAIFGGLIGGVIGAAIWAHHKKYSVLLLADALAPGLLVAQAIGRLGNWFNQELYGTPTTLPWGLKLNDANAIGKTEACYTGGTTACPSGANTLFHPTFLYEMIWNLIGAALIVFVVSRFAKKLKTGQIFAIYLVWYGLGRSWIEMLRINLSTEFLGIRTNVWAAICVIFIGLVLFTVLLQYGAKRSASIHQLQLVTERDLEKEASRAAKAGTDAAGAVNAEDSVEKNASAASEESGDVTTPHSADDSSAEDGPADASDAQ